MSANKTKISDDYFEFMLKGALGEYEAEENEKLKEKAQDIDEPVYSDKYKSEIDKLFKNKYYNKKTKHKKSKAAAIIIVLAISGTAITINADANLKSFVNRLFIDKGTNIDITQNTTSLNYDFSVIPEEWEYFYIPDYLPAGYKVESITADKMNIMIEYSKGVDEIFFTESPFDDSTLHLDTEHSKLKKVKINYNDGYFLQTDGNSTLVWNYDELSFQINANLDEKEITKIAKSLKIIDR